MTSNDSHDNHIREAMGEVIAHAPIAPDFDDVAAHPTQRRSRHPVMAVAGGAAAASAAAAIVLAAGDGDTTVDATAPPSTTSAAAADCEAIATSLIAPETDALLTVRPSADAELDQLEQRVRALAYVDAVTVHDQEGVRDHLEQLLSDSELHDIQTDALPRVIEVDSPETTVRQLLSEELSEERILAEIRGRDEFIQQKERDCRGARSTPPTTEQPPRSSESFTATTLSADPTEAPMAAVRGVVRSLLPHAPDRIESRTAGTTGGVYSEFEFIGDTSAPDNAEQRSFTLWVYEAGAFDQSEATAMLDEIPTDRPARAWFTDDADRSSLYYRTDTGVGLRLTSTSPPTGTPLAEEQLLQTARTLAEHPAVVELTKPGDT